jgi:hypothetical protein
LRPIRGPSGQGAAVNFRRRDRPAGPATRLMHAAGLDPGAAGDISDQVVCQTVAYSVTQREFGNAAALFAVVEELLADKDNYDFVISFLEDVQNLVSHHISTLFAPGEITPWLGRRSAACWATRTRFWDSVTAWCSQTGVRLEPGDELRSVQNDKLRALMWSASRTLPTGATVGLAQAVLYEKAGGPPILGYSHIAAAIKTIRSS